ncbi:hypothetical protein WA026_011452 [Henosepilachna vigintioctopunctata]|uniref:SAP domain-containing protein n=1 Tax=Henosepilachna vigintioctopunctata TaxID=420089 RepID=A0AAW1TR83_9CUCU
MSKDLKAESDGILGLSEITENKLIWRMLVAEFIGTLLLVFIGCGSIISLGGSDINIVQIALTFGLTIATIVQLLKMSPTIDPSKLRVTELREELQARDLDTKGNKPVLVKRLFKEDELDKELPDTSIADTSTENLDSSCVEEKNNTVETETPDRKPSIDSRTSPHESEAEQSVNNDELDEATANTANIDELNKTANDGECISNVFLSGRAYDGSQQSHHFSKHP